MHVYIHIRNHYIRKIITERDRDTERERADCT